jgi:hypothetical protein
VDTVLGGMRVLQAGVEKIDEAVADPDTGLAAIRGAVGSESDLVTAGTLHSEIRKLRESVNALAPLSGVQLYVGSTFSLMIAQARADEMLDGNGMMEPYRARLRRLMVAPDSNLRPENWESSDPTITRWTERHNGLVHTNCTNIYAYRNSDGWSTAYVISDPTDRNEYVPSTYADKLIPHNLLRNRKADEAYIGSVSEIYL